MAKKLKIYNGSSWEDVTFAITPPNTAVTNAFTTNQVIETSTSVAALRITQNGSGEAFRVEDSTNPDSSPFVIDASGNVGVGIAPSQAFQVHRDGANATVHLTTGTSGSLGSDGFSLVSETGTLNAFIIQREAADLILRTSNTERMRIDSIGNVGIGTSAPKTRFHTTGTSSASMPTLGTASGILYVSNTDINYGLLAGVNSSSGAVWLQAQRTDGNATAYDILLNPSGGNVGIGISTPVFKLQTYNELSSATVGAQALVFQAQIANGNQDYLKLYSERTLSGGASWSTQDWILRRHVDATPMGGIKWGAGEWNPTAFYGAPTSQSIRTTYISTGTPSGGIDGDMWATYV